MKIFVKTILQNLFKQFPRLWWLFKYYRHLLLVARHELPFNQVHLQTDWSTAQALFDHCAFSQAIPYFLRVITVQSNHAEAHYQLGYACCKLGQFEVAIDYFRRAAALKPDCARLHFSIGLQHSSMAFPGESAWSNARIQEMANHYYHALKLQQTAQQNTEDFSFEDYLSISTTLFCHGDLDGAVHVYRSYYMPTRQREAQRLGLDQLNLRFIGSGALCGIGGLAHLDGYIKTELLWRSHQPRPIFLAPIDQIPNQAYLNYWRKYITVITDPQTITSLKVLESYYADDPVWMLKTNDDFLIAHTTIGIAQQQWEHENRPPLLSLTDEDRTRGWQCLQSLGVPQDSWFVCIHVRESGFKDGELITERLRNAEITTYISAIKTIVERGGWVIRMGDPSMQPLPDLPQVIDYAHSPAKSDWMDVFLCGACRFFIGTSSGLFAVSASFGIPVVVTNYLPLHAIKFARHDLYLPKLFYSKAQDRILSFEESVSSPLREYYFQYQYDIQGLQPTSNTADELTDIVLEMMDRLDGKAIDTPEDEALQVQFNSLVHKHDTFHTNSRIGQKFLQTHRHLLPGTP